jgi:phospho-N-acetylmuramoyl-pentapeptide-transferase
MTNEFFQIVRVLLIGGVSFAGAMLIEPLMYRMLLTLGRGKQIRTEGAPVFASLHVKKAGTPTMGGVMIWLVVAALALLLFGLSQTFDGLWSWLSFLSRGQTLLPLAAFVFAALVGLFDDLLGVFGIGPRGGGLRVREKVLLYTVIAAIGAWWFYAKLGFDALHVPFWGDVTLGFWYVPFFVLTVAATVFSMNEADGLDGLAGGISLPAYGALGVVAFVQGRYDLAVLTAAILGALLAFLWHNIYPAKFFMGDTGAMSLGIGIGVIAMLTNTPLLLPFFGFILVVESLSVIVQKASKLLFGTKPFLSTPIHHHFEARGWHETRVTMRFWIVSGIAASLGLVVFFLDRLLS